jgi:hypothetical protein
VKNRYCKSRKNSEAQASLIVLALQVVFLGQHVGKVFEHIEYRRAFRGRQALLIKEILSAKDQYTVLLLDVSRFNTVNKIFMFTNDFIGLNKERFTVNRLSCRLHVVSSKKTGASLRPHGGKGQYLAVNLRRVKKLTMLAGIRFAC